MYHFLSAAVGTGLVAGTAVAASPLLKTAPGWKCSSRASVVKSGSTTRPGKLSVPQFGGIAGGAFANGGGAGLADGDGGTAGG